MNRVAAIAAAAAVSLCFALPASAQDAAKIEKGKQLYTDQKCKLCHSVAGEGNKKGPLDEVAGSLTADDVKAWLVTPDEMAAKHGKDRKPKMKKFDTLSAEDIDALVAYVLSLKK